MYTKNAIHLMSMVCDRSTKFLMIYLKGENDPLMFPVDFMGDLLPLNEYFELILSELIEERGSEERDMKMFEFMQALIEKPVDIIVDLKTVSAKEVSKFISCYKDNPLFTGLYMFEKDDKCFLWNMATKSYKIVDPTSNEWVLAIEKYNYNKEEVVEDGV